MLFSYMNVSRNWKAYGGSFVDGRDIAGRVGMGHWDYVERRLNSEARLPMRATVSKQFSIRRNLCHLPRKHPIPGLEQ